MSAVVQELRPLERPHSKERSRVLAELRTSLSSARADREARANASFSTGIAELDALLPLGGLVRGQLTELMGPRGAGSTTFVLSLIQRVASLGERAAIVDLDGDLDPANYGRHGLGEALWIVRSRTNREGLWATDQLVRSGHFALVVVDGVTRAQSGQWVRLQRQARDTQTVLLVRNSTPSGLNAPGRQTLRLRTLGVQWGQGLCERLSGLHDTRDPHTPPHTPIVPTYLCFAIQVGRGHGEVHVRFPCHRQWDFGAHAEIADRRPAKWTEVDANIKRKNLRDMLPVYRGNPPRAAQPPKTLASWGRTL